MTGSIYVCKLITFIFSYRRMGKFVWVLAYETSTIKSQIKDFFYILKYVRRKISNRCVLKYRETYIPTTLHTFMQQELLSQNNLELSAIEQVIDHNISYIQ